MIDITNNPIKPVNVIDGNTTIIYQQRPYLFENIRIDRWIDNKPNDIYNHIEKKRRFGLKDLANKGIAISFIPLQDFTLPLFNK